MVRTRSDADRIAAGNVRVPHAEFRSVWDEATRRGAEPGDDRFADAVAQTCRWMAAIPMRTALCGGLPRSPVTQRACVARPELIDAECRSAQHDDGFAASVAARPGWCDGVRATFRWAWLGEGAAPVALPGPRRTHG